MVSSMEHRTLSITWHCVCRFLHLISVIVVFHFALIVINYMLLSIVPLFLYFLVCSLVPSKHMWLLTWIWWKRSLWNILTSFLIGWWVLFSCMFLDFSAVYSIIWHNISALLHVYAVDMIWNTLNGQDAKSIFKSCYRLEQRSVICLHNYTSCSTNGVWRTAVVSMWYIWLTVCKLGGILLLPACPYFTDPCVAPHWLHTCLAFMATLFCGGNAIWLCKTQPP